MAGNYGTSNMVAFYRWSSIRDRTAAGRFRSILLDFVYRRLGNWKNCGMIWYAWYTRSCARLRVPCISLTSVIKNRLVRCDVLPLLDRCFDSCFVCNVQRGCSHGLVAFGRTRHWEPFGNVAFKSFAWGWLTS